MEEGITLDDSVEGNSSVSKALFMSAQANEVGDSLGYGFTEQTHGDSTSRLTTNFNIKVDLVSDGRFL